MRCKVKYIHPTACVLDPLTSHPPDPVGPIEPTESESLFEIDRFAEAMLLIREEIREIEQGKAERAWPAAQDPLPLLMRRRAAMRSGFGLRPPPGSLKGARRWLNGWVGDPSIPPGNLKK